MYRSDDDLDDIDDSDGELSCDTHEEVPVTVKPRKYCPVCGESWSTAATTAVCGGVVVTLTTTPLRKDTR